MGGQLKPDIESRSVGSQATPLAGDYLEYLRKEITGGFTGTPQQAQAGTAIQQFINARENPAQFEQLMGPLKEMFNRQTDVGAAGVREGFSQSGNRLSTGLAREEGNFRGNRANSLDAMMSELFLAEQGKLLQAIMGQHQFGTTQMNPVLQMAGLGVNPDQTIVSDSPLVTGFKIFTDLLNAASGFVPGSGARTSSESGTKIAAQANKGLLVTG